MSFDSVNYEQGSISPLEAHTRSKALQKKLKTSPDLEGILKLQDGSPNISNPNKIGSLVGMLANMPKDTRPELMARLEKHPDYTFWAEELKNNGGWKAMKNLPEINDAVYPSSTIEPRLKEVATEYFRNAGIDVKSSKETVAGVGVRHILNSYVGIMNKEGRDKIFFPAPGYGSYNEILYDRGGTVVPIQTSTPEYKLTPELLEKSHKERPEIKDLLLTIPNNPTGTIYTEKELRAIGEKALELDIFVVIDEIHRGLETNPQEKSTVSFASLGKKFYDNSLTITAMGKGFGSAATRIGIGVTGNEELADTIVNKAVRGSTSSPSPVDQLAAEMILKYTPKTYFDKNREKYQENLTVAKEQMKKINNNLERSESNIRIGLLTEPDAAFYATIKFTDIKGQIGYDGEPLNNSLKLMEHIALSNITKNGNTLEGTPGVVFVDGDSLGLNNTISARLTLVQHSQEEIKEAFSRIENALIKLTPERQPKKEAIYANGSSVHDHVLNNGRNINQNIAV